MGVMCESVRVEGRSGSGVRCWEGCGIYVRSMGLGWFDLEFGRSVFRI